MTAKTITRTRANTAPAPAPAPKQKAYAFVEGARPERGSMLYAHTYAVLRFFKLTEGRSAVRSSVEAFMGTRAVAYHIKGKNFTVTGTALRLSERGGKVFEARRISGKFDEVLSDAYLAAFSGKVSKKHGIEKAMLHPVAI
jgi:hypothetical protein